VLRWAVGAGCGRQAAVRRHPAHVEPPDREVVDLGVDGRRPAAGGGARGGGPHRGHARRRRQGGAGRRDAAHVDGGGGRHRTADVLGERGLHAARGRRRPPGRLRTVVGGARAGAGRGRGRVRRRQLAHGAAPPPAGPPRRHVPARRGL